jgi:hypothetical protein
MPTHFFACAYVFIYAFDGLGFRVPFICTHAYIHTHTHTHMYLFVGRRWHTPWTRVRGGTCSCAVRTASIYGSIYTDSPFTPKWFLRLYLSLSLSSLSLSLPLPPPSPFSFSRALSLSLYSCVCVFTCACAYVCGGLLYACIYGYIHPSLHTCRATRDTKNASRCDTRNTCRGNTRHKKHTCTHASQETHMHTCRGVHTKISGLVIRVPDWPD